MKDTKAAPDDHPYLAKKGVKAHGLLINRAERLIVPARDINGALHSIQYIAPDGAKDFLKGGRKKGNFFVIGELNSAFCVAEGFATAASIHEATGQAVVVAFDAGNLLPVVTELRAKFPFAAITIAADDDIAVDGNPGITKATEAAQAIRASLAVPDFGESRPEKATDFNDLFKHAGASAVAEQIKRAKLPEAPDAEAEIERLSKLTYIEFEQAHKAEAKKLGIRATALDKMVDEKRPKDKEKPSLGIFDPEPWPEPVDGVELLDEIYRVVGRFLVCTEAERIAVTLWVALTWFEEAAQVAPILDISAPVEECGKSTLVSIVGRLVKRPLASVSISGAAIYRVIEKHCPTLLIDEADSFFAGNEIIRGIIDSGHTREQAFVLRCDGDSLNVERFSTWSFKVISGIGSRARTLESRSIRIKLRRKFLTQKTERLRHAYKGPFDEAVQMLARFSADNMDAFARARPVLPEVLSDRQQGNWEGLFIVAELAGGHWPQRATDAAMTHVSMPIEPSEALTLLADIHGLFKAKSPVPEAMSSANIVEALRLMLDKDWDRCDHGKRLTQNSLARRL